MREGGGEGEGGRYDSVLGSEFVEVFEAFGKADCRRFENNQGRSTS